MRLRLDLQGAMPLLMHNQRLANPLDEHTKALAALTAKRSKTDDDHKLIADTEYLGALYVNSGGPFVPHTWILGSLIDAGKITRNGTDIRRSVVMLEPEISLQYNGPRRPSELVADANFRSTDSVKIGTKRLMRTRPKFSDWSLTTVVELETQLLDLETFVAIAERAGKVVGIGDWRPMYGTYRIGVSQVEVA